MDIRLGCITITNFSWQAMHRLVEDAPGAFMHSKLAAGFLSTYKDYDSPPPSLARMPVIGLIAAPLGELTALTQVIAGVAGMALFSLPAICLPTARSYFKTSAETAAAGAFMAMVYPILFVTGHTIGFCRCG